MTSPNEPRTTGAVGAPINRVDGQLKVTGAARYSAEIPVDDLAYGVIVQSTIARGTIDRIDAGEAEQLPGVIAVMTPRNAPKLESLQKFEREGSKGSRPTGRALSLLQNDSVHYNGQPIALVIAESIEVAMHAASLVRATYRVDQPTIDMATALPSAYPSLDGEDLRSRAAGDPARRSPGRSRRCRRPSRRRIYDADGDAQSDGDACHHRGVGR